MSGQATQKRTNPTLLALATVTRYDAQRLTGYNYGLLLLSSILSCWAVFYNEKIAWFLVTAGFLVKMASFLISVKARNLHIVSREAQRLALLEDSYGKILETFQVVEVRKRVGPAREAVALQANYTQPYYTGTEPTGNARLRENIQQSAFWSRNLLEMYAQQILYTVIIAVALLGLFTYVLLVLAPESRYFTLNPYLLSLGALTLGLGLIEYLNIYVSCNSSIQLLLEVDQRLDRINIDIMAALLANFADYSIASVMAPPIPYNIYKKNQSYLKGLWAQRLETKGDPGHQGVSQVAEVPVDIDSRVVMPTWLEKGALLQLVREAAVELSRLSGKPLPTKISVYSIASLSGTPVFDVRFYQDAILWRQLILRLHKSAEDANKELVVVQRISNENVDVISYCPFKEPFISKGALFYYHANIQTNDQLLHVHDFILGFLNSSQGDFDSYFMKMFQGFRSVSHIYDSITGTYNLKNVGEVCGSIKRSVPPSFIIDLRRNDYHAGNNTLQVSLKGTYPSENGIILSSPLHSSASNWIKAEFEVIRTGSHSGDVYEIDLVALAEGTCRILIDSARSRDFLARLGGKVSLLFVPNEHLMSLNQFMRSELQISLNGFEPLKLLAALDTKFAKYGLYYAFRHRDLHTMNCLVSQSNFKVVDIGDSAEAMICADVARLEISLLSHLVHALHLQAHDVEKVLALIDDPDKGQLSSANLTVISKIIKELRACFLSQFRTAPTTLDWALCYYTECCQQLSWSISSPVGFRKGIDPLISYWDDKVQELIQ